MCVTRLTGLGRKFKSRTPSMPTAVGRPPAALPPRRSRRRALYFGHSLSAAHSADRALIVFEHQCRTNVVAEYRHLLLREHVLQQGENTLA